MREEKKYSKRSFKTKIRIDPNEIKLGCKFNLFKCAMMQETAVLGVL